MRWGKQGGLFFAVVTSVLLCSVSALGAEPPIEAARALARDGVKLYEAGDYGQALENFQKADALFGAPQNRVYAARCLDKLGRLVDALARYDTVVDELLADDAPTSFRDAQTVALTERALLKKRIPTLSIKLTDADLTGVEVLVDGVIVERASLASVPLDVGAHSVVVRRDRQEATATAVTLIEGQREALELSAPPRNAVSTSGSSDGWVGPGVLLGAGGAFLVAGLASGAWTLVEVNDLRSRCTDGGRCPEADAERGATASTVGNVSTGTLVIGGASAAAGLIWLGVARPWEASKTVDVTLGPSGVSLAHRFD